MSQLSDNNSGEGFGAMEAFGVQTNGAEEQPSMRSVALIPGAPKLTPLSSGPNFGISPTTGLARPKTRLRTSFTVTQEWTGTVDAATWDVKTEDLESVPVDFPLERTHREILCDPAEVGKRISESLQRMSVDATYDKAKAKCKTMECVTFRIRLYDGGVNGQPVVVEVQRRSGSTSSFMRSCRAVLDAAEGITDEAGSKAPKKFAPPPMNVSGMKCLQSVEVPASDPEKDAKLAFDSASAMLKSGKYDSVVLGLQSLCNLTDPLKTSPRNAILVSKWILFGEVSMRQDIMVRIQGKAEDDSEDLALVFEQQKHFALIAIANALEVCATDGCLRKEKSSSVETELLPALVEVIEDASNRAGNAYNASRSIYSLLTGSDLSFNDHADALKALQTAHEIGLESHDLLAGETRRCLDAATKNDL